MATGLTVAEKQHWKERISARIDKKIEAIHAQAPALVERVDRDSRTAALASMGLDDHHRTLALVEDEIKKANKRKDRIEKAMLAIVRGVPADELGHVCYGAMNEVNTAVERRQKIHKDELLAKDEVGRKILALEAEKENLLDTVWLATSSKQIKELWTKVGVLLDDPLTTLAADALAIEPTQE